MCSIRVILLDSVIRLAIPYEYELWTYLISKFVVPADHWPVRKFACGLCSHIPLKSLFYSEWYYQVTHRYKPDGLIVLLDLSYLNHQQVRPKIRYLRSVVCPSFMHADTKYLLHVFPHTPTVTATLVCRISCLKHCCAPPTLCTASILIYTFIQTSLK